MEKEIEKPLNSEVAEISEVAVFTQYDMAIAYMNWEWLWLPAQDQDRQKS